MSSPEQTALTVAHWRAGRQCARRLWLEAHAPALAGPPDPELVARRALAATMTRLARTRFPGGVAVGDDAAADTRRLLDDPSVPAIFDGLVVAGDAQVRVDVLARSPDGRFDLYSVRAAASLRAEHLDDLALRLHVLTIAGLAIARVIVLLVDREAVRDGEPLRPAQLLRAVEVTDDVRARATGVPARLAAMRDVLAARAEPAVEPSPHCTRPHRCGFWEHCTAAQPADWIMHLPRFAPNQYAALREAGITRIRDIPDEWWLTGPQARARTAARSGHVVVAPGLARALTGSGPPAAYLDFETISPAVPLFPGTRPYAVVPFQWSLHRADATGALTHLAFLAEGDDDPRPAFVEHLLAATVGTEPILVYSGYEGRVLDDLARAFPEHAAALTALGARLVDLLEVVLAHVYHPDFAGSFSLKRVGPVLAPSVAWDTDGGISGGYQASDAFLALRAGAFAPDAAARVRRALLAYCATDTRALVALHRALLALAA